MGWDLMHGHVIELDRSDLASHVEAAGVAVVNWRESGNLQSHLLDRAIERAAGEFPDVQFGTVDIAHDERLAQEWAVEEVPTLMIYRDGTLLFTATGELPPGGIETLLESAWSVDMAAARRGVNGHQGRFVLGFQRGTGPAGGPRNENGSHGGLPAGGASGK